MSIGQKDFVTKKNHTQTGTDTVNLEWGDDNVQMFLGASGAKNVVLPVGNVANSYGEVWIVNAQAAGDLTVTADTDGTNNIQNIVGDANVVISKGETAHFFYVPYLRNVAKPLQDSTLGVSKEKRGMWIGGVMGLT